jgi:NusA-like KH domain protein
MVNTLCMEDIMRLNLFNKITRVQTRFCIKYNDALIFCVPYNMLQQAVGEDGKNVHKMREILRKRVKIIPSPRGIQDLKKFIENIVSPVTFKDAEVVGDEIVISANRQSKAALIGRDKRRLKEMQEITKDFFGKDARIA